MVASKPAAQNEVNLGFISPKTGVFKEIGTTDGLQRFRALKTGFLYAIEGINLGLELNNDIY